MPSKAPLWASAYPLQTGLKTNPPSELYAQSINPMTEQVTPLPASTLWLQRSPRDFPKFDTDTFSLHEQLVDEYVTATGTEKRPGLQYTEGYRSWLRDESSKYQFLPPTVTRQNPLDGLAAGRSINTTTFIINGTKFPPGGSIGTLVGQYQKAITPSTVTAQPEATGVSCRFGRDFQIQSSAEIVVPSAPGPRGWQKTLAPNQVLLPADQSRCAGQSAVRVTLRGQPSDEAYARIIENSEKEHAQALEMLHNKHFAPYYHFVRNLQATGSNERDCAADLRRQIGKRDEQAALGFILGDLAETRRFDDPALGTHHGRLIPTIGDDCNEITITASQVRPQQPGLEPGNVRVIAPRSRRVEPANLQVSGNDLNAGNTLIRSFSSPANANLALQVFQHYNITELLRLGSFEFLLSNGNPPSGALAGLQERSLNPDAYQVTFGVTGATDWAIVEVVLDQVNLIHGFGASRDEAYSAVALMRQYGFNREAWVGTGNLAELKFFRKD